MSAKIEFRVLGKDSEQVAEELAHRLRTRFHADPVVERGQSATDGASGTKATVELAVALVSVAVPAGFEIYKLFIREPREKAEKELIEKWHALIDWARTLLPTTIHAVIGKDQLDLHNSSPSEIHRLTRKAMGEVKVVHAPE